MNCPLCNKELVMITIANDKVNMYCHRNEDYIYCRIFVKEHIISINSDRVFLYCVNYEEGSEFDKMEWTLLDTVYEYTDGVKSFFLALKELPKLGMCFCHKTEMEGFPKDIFDDNLKLYLTQNCPIHYIEWQARFYIQYKDNMEAQKAFQEKVAAKVLELRAKGENK